MKKIFLSLITGLILLVISCNDKTAASSSGLSEKAQKNLDASREISNAFGSGDVSKIDSVVASDFVDHNAQMGDVGRDSLKAMMVSVHRDFPDAKMEVIKEFADDDFVFSQMRFTGTSNGQMGMPAGPYDMRAIQVTKFRDGKAVEHWEYMEMGDMMKMMAAMSPTNKPDTTKTK
jgi:predicted SnoaL-like aldol condensation-catalyzing enzyme